MRKLAEGLEDLRTAEGTPLPQNTLSELRRHLARLRFVRDQIRAVEQERLRKLAVAPAAETKSPDAMVRLIARVFGACIDTTDMLVNEIFSRHWRDRKAVARYAGFTGSPDESGSRRRERGLARAAQIVASQYWGGREDITDRGHGADRHRGLGRASPCAVLHLRLRLILHLQAEDLGDPGGSSYQLAGHR
jgi:transposase